MVGVLLVRPTLHALEEVKGAVTLGEVADRHRIAAAPDRSMFDIFGRIARHEARYVLVVVGEARLGPTR